MKEFGLSILGRAIYDATFSEMMRPFAHALSVTHAAHAAEIILKARIAEEHPLLIFKKLPSQLSTSKELTVNELFAYAKSYLYVELPDLLWATTGIRIEKIEEFKAFGKLRNQITHFAVPAVDLPTETMKFAITVLDPIVEKFWGKSAIPYAEDWDDVIISEGYLETQLNQIGIEIDERLRAILGADSRKYAEEK